MAAAERERETFSHVMLWGVSHFHLSCVASDDTPLDHAPLSLPLASFTPLLLMVAQIDCVVLRVDCSLGVQGPNDVANLSL